MNSKTTRGAAAKFMTAFTAFAAAVTGTVLVEVGEAVGLPVPVGLTMPVG